MAKSFLEKQINKKVGGMKRSAKSKVGLRKSNKGCLLFLIGLLVVCVVVVII